jgi:hypothetical protein
LFPPVITALKAAQKELAPSEIDARLTRMVDDAFWFIDALERSERHLNGAPLGLWAPNTAIQGKGATREFFFDLFPTYQHIFERPPARSKTESKSRPLERLGPTRRFIEAVLEAVRKNLMSAGLDTVANDDSLRPKPDTVEGWIREYRSRMANPD